MKTLVYVVAIILSTTLVSAKTTVQQYDVYELSFTGPAFQTANTPTRDIELVTVWQHVSGQRFKIWGFYDGDGWSETDVIEAMLGAFLGGGYATTGYKHPKTKQGHYFAGDFSADEHTAAVNLKLFRDVIDANISFWKMEPVFVSSTGATHTSRFSHIAGTFRAMQWPGHEYVLGTNQQKENIRVNLPQGSWTITRYDLINQTTKVLASHAIDDFTFNAPDSRAVLFHVKRNSSKDAQIEF